MAKMTRLVAFLVIPVAFKLNAVGGGYLYVLVGHFSEFFVLLGDKCVKFRIGGRTGNEVV